MNVQRLWTYVLSAVFVAVMTFTEEAGGTEYIIYTPDEVSPGVEIDVYDTNEEARDTGVLPAYVAKYLLDGNTGNNAGGYYYVESNTLSDIVPFVGNALSINGLDLTVEELEKADNFSGALLGLGNFTSRTLSFDRIDMLWNNEGTLYGVRSIVDSFNGTLNAESLIIVNQSASGDAVGYQFDSVGIAGQIDVGSITVTAGGSATGFAADNVSADSLILWGDVHVEAGTGNAVGLSTGTGTGTLTIGQNVSAISDGGAATAIQTNYNIVLDTTNSEKLSIYAAGGTGSTGINLRGNDRVLTIQGTELFTNDDKHFTVVFSGTRAPTVNFSTDVDLDKSGGTINGVQNINIDSGRSVWLGNTNINDTIAGQLNVNVGEGAYLGTSGTVHLIGTGNRINGGGVVYLGGVNVSQSATKITIEDESLVTLGVDVTGITLGDYNFDIDLGESGTLELWGTTPSPDNLNNLTIIGGREQIIQESIFGEWSVIAKPIPQNWGLSSYSSHRYANMSDGYLIAAMMHNTYTGYGMVSKHFISAPSPRRHVHYRGQSTHGEQCLCDDCDEYSPPGTRSAWMNYVGRGDTYKGWASGNKWELGAHGIQFGVDLCRSSWHQFGIIFGYEAGKAKNSGDQVDADDYYLGVYAARVFRNGADARFLFNQGWQRFNMTRNGWDSNFNGNTQEFNLELGKRFHRGVWSVRPLIGLDFFLTHLDGAEERGAGRFESVRYDKTNLTQVFLRSGFELRARWQQWTLNSGLTYSHGVQNEELRTHVWEIGGDERNLPLQGTKVSGSLLSFNVGGEFLVEKNFSFFGGYEGRAALDRSGGYQSIGQVGGLWKW